MPKYKICLINKNSTTRYPLNYLLISAKTYFEENSQYSAEWEWGTPSYDYESYENLLQQVIAEKPDVVGISMYVWNEAFSLKMARELKEALKDVIILFGGPQNLVKHDNTFFQKYPFVDIVFPGDAYGETSINDVLENISRNQGQFNAAKVDYCYWPDDQRIAQFNPLLVKKKDFNWPKNPFRAQEHIIKPILDNYPDQEAKWLIIETSRGCPYKCSFCDWGGGTYTKTVKKPFAYVLDELTWLSENQVTGIFFMDANFGLFDIDIEYTKHLVNLVEKNHFPKRAMVQPTKSKLQNLYRIYDLLVSQDLIAQYMICAQDLNEDVKKNVDRIDFSFEEQVEMFKTLQKKKYLPIGVDYILGLPGSSLTTIREAIHRFSLAGVGTPIGYYWNLLPETPAYDPAYREKFKLVTINKKQSAATGVYLKIKENRSSDRERNVNMSLEDGMDMTSEYVIGSFSYTTTDWVHMNLLLLITSVTQSTKIVDKLADYLWKHYQINYGDFFQTLVDTLLTDTRVDPSLQKNFVMQLEALNEWIYADRRDMYCDYDEDFPFTLAPTVYLLFIILIDLEHFFEAVILATEKVVAVDDKIIDLIEYSKQTVIDLTYRPGRTFATEYDWQTYLTSGELIHQKTHYKITDDIIIAGGKWFDIDWEQYVGSKNYLTHFIYRACYDHRSSKSAFNIVKIDET